jgi:hypothetical protein
VVEKDHPYGDVLETVEGLGQSKQLDFGTGPKVTRGDMNDADGRL